jgi:hypothetical protein
VRKLGNALPDERDDIGAICLHDPNFGGTSAAISITVFFYNKECAENQRVSLSAATVRLMDTITAEFAKGVIGEGGMEELVAKIRKVIISPSSKIHWSEAYDRVTGTIQYPGITLESWPSIAATEERPFF